MNIKINAELESKDILDFFSNKLKENGVDPSNGNFHFQVQNKNGEWVEVSSDKLKFSFGK